MNALLSATSLLFSLLTFPYLSRVLLAEGMGRASFAQSIIDYASTFALLGIPHYGIKACVEVRDNPLVLAQRVKELQVLATIFSSLSLLGLYSLYLWNPQIYAYRWELLILVFNLPLKAMGAEYYFRATEQFSYITYRSLFIRLSGLLAIFLFVRNRQDLFFYLAISVFLTSGSNLFNAFYLIKKLDYRQVKKLTLRPHLKPIFSFFLISMGWMMYENTDVIMLGSLTNEQQVGFYNASIRIKTLLVVVLNALLQVVLPRMIQGFQKQREDANQEFIRFVSSLGLLFSIYTTGFIFLSAPSVLQFLAGNEFIVAIPILKWTILEFLPITAATLLYYILMATSRERQYYRAYFVGIGVNVLCNLYFIPRFKATGAGVATFLGTSVIFILLQIGLKGEGKNYWDWSNIRKLVVVSFLSLLGLGLLQKQINLTSSFLQLLLTGGMYSFIFFGLAYLLREEVTIFFLHRLKHFLKRS